MPMLQCCLSFFSRDRTFTCALPGRGGENIRIKLITENRQERGRAKSYVDKEPEGIQWLLRYTKPGEVFWDIGSCVGQYALYAAKIGCRVIAVEPHIPNAHKLLRNVKANDLLASISVVPICLLEGERFGGFFVSSFEPGTSIHKFSDTQAGGTSAIAFPGHTTLVEYSHHVFCSTVDRLVREWGFPEPHHIKIDVDGPEAGVLEGMSGILQAAKEKNGDSETFPYSGRLKSVLMEVHDDDLERTRSFMSMYGFVEDDSFPETSRQREKRRAIEEGGRWAGCGNAVFVKR